jgi:carbon monoxide dehydrogenase subunit G
MRAPLPDPGFSRILHLAIKKGAMPVFQTVAEITINRPVEEVFAFIADNQNDPQWCVPVVETTRIAGNAPGVGARYAFASQVGLMKLRGEFEITGFEAPEAIRWTGESSIVKFSGQYRLESTAAGTRLEERTTFEPKGLLKLLQATMIPQYTTTYETQLQRLKHLLEDRTD